MKRTLLGLVLLSAGFGCSKADYKEVDSVGAMALTQAPGAVILDVRTPEEYAEGHIPGAKLIPLSELRLSAERLPGGKSASVLVYCRTGMRSALAASTLQKMGWTDVSSFKGGIIAWQAAGYPVVKGGV